MSEGWLIRVASRADVGAGHVSRCRVLARALARLSPTTLVLDDADWMERLSHEPFEVATSAGNGPLAGVVVDSYDLAEAEWGALRSRARILAQVDDFLAPRMEVDIVINAAPHLDGTSIRGKPALLGSAFASVDPRYALPARTVVEGIGSILVSFGTSDPADATGLALDALAVARLGGQVVVALGSRARHLDAARRRTEALGAKLLVDASDLLTPLAAADLALGAGGVGLLERMAAGVPSLSLAIANNQQIYLQGAAERGATRYLGRIEEVPVERLAEALIDLAGDRSARETMARAGRAMVDGRGAERIAVALLECARRAA